MGFNSAFKGLMTDMKLLVVFRIFAKVVISHNSTTTNDPMTSRSREKHFDTRK